MVDDQMSWVLRDYLVQTPMFLIWLVGIILAIVNLPRHPQVSTFALVVFLIFLVKALAYPFAFHWAIRQEFNQFGNRDRMVTLTFIIAFINQLVSALLLGLLFFAIFGWRRGLRQSYD